MGQNKNGNGNSNGNGNETKTIPQQSYDFIAFCASMREANNIDGDTFNCNEDETRARASLFF